MFESCKFHVWVTVLLKSNVVLRTSHFSGLGTAEWAALALQSAMKPHLGDGLAFQFSSSCEYAPHARQALQQLPGHGHLFSNIMDFVPARVHDKIQEAAIEQEGSSAKILKAFCRVKMLSAAACCIHGRDCLFRTGDIDISGSPCTDYSRQGNMKGRDGPQSGAQLFIDMPYASCLCCCNLMLCECSGLCV